MYGTQTANLCVWQIRMFENDVKMYGTQTQENWHFPYIRLRMM